MPGERTGSDRADGVRHACMQGMFRAYPSDIAVFIIHDLDRERVCFHEGDVLDAGEELLRGHALIHLGSEEQVGDRAVVLVELDVNAERVELLHIKVADLEDRGQHGSLQGAAPGHALLAVHGPAQTPATLTQCSSAARCLWLRYEENMPTCRGRLRSSQCLASTGVRKYCNI